MYIYMHMYMYMYVYTYIHVHVYIHGHGITHECFPSRWFSYTEEVPAVYVYFNSWRGFYIWE
jgi:hypothetical protein